MTRLRRISVSCAIVILVFLGFYVLMIKPRIDMIRKLNKEHEQVAKLLNDSKELINRYKDIKAAFDDISMEWERLQESLPDEEEMPALLRAVSAAGKQSGVNFLLFKPLPTTAKDFYTENPVQIKVSAGYHEVGMFLSRIAQLGRLVNVSKFKFTSSKSQEAVLEAEFIATAYTTTKVAGKKVEEKPAKKKKKK